MAKIVIIYRYFWPDTPPYATMLRDIAGALVVAGHEVEIITAQPSYKADVANQQRPWFEELDGINVRRLRLFNERGSAVLKLINSVLFVLQAFALLTFSRRRDIYWTATMPPVVQPFLISLCARIKKGRFIYHMQDIYPEIATVTPGMKINPFVSSLMLRLDRHTQKHSDAIIVLSNDMKDAIIERGIQASKIIESNNFSLVENDQINKLNLASAPKDTEKVKFIFAGNVGRFQNLDALVSAFEKLQAEDVELIILGAGRAKNDLIKQVERRSIKNVIFKDHLPAEEAFEYLTRCHVGIVSLSPKIIKYAFPSKVLTYMAANLPIFAFVEDESSLAKLLRTKDIGGSVSWLSDMDVIAQKIREMAQSVRSQQMMPAKHRELYSKQFAQERMLEMINRLSTKSVEGRAKDS